MLPHKKAVRRKRATTAAGVLRSSGRVSSKQGVRRDHKFPNGVRVDQKAIITLHESQAIYIGASSLDLSDMLKQQRKARKLGASKLLEKIKELSVN